MKVDRRRRRESKTNYLKRIKLLKSNAPRLVLRKTNKYLIVQYVKSAAAQDKIVFGINSKKLLQLGWPKNLSCSLKSITAAYFLGMLAGKEIKTKKLKNPIFDFGLQRVLSGSKIQGFIKGVIDSGIELKHNEKSFPTEERIYGKHLKQNLPFEQIKKNI